MGYMQSSLLSISEIALIKKLAVLVDLPIQV
jgi:hypothetical protein